MSDEPTFTLRGPNQTLRVDNRPIFAVLFEGGAVFYSSDGREVKLTGDELRDMLYALACKAKGGRR